MRSTTRVTRKGLRKQKHSEATVRQLPTRRMATQAILADAEELLARQARIDHPDVVAPLIRLAEAQRNSHIGCVCDRCLYHFNKRRH